MLEKTFRLLCDRCGAEFKGFIDFDNDEVSEQECFKIRTIKRRFALGRYKWGSGFEYVHLCPKCAKELKRWMRKESEDDTTEQYYKDLANSYEKTINKLTKAIAEQEPKPKIGHWIIIDDRERFIARCSECGREEDSRRVEYYPYCHCGAKMKSERIR